MVAKHITRINKLWLFPFLLLLAIIGIVCFILLTDNENSYRTIDLWTNGPPVENGLAEFDENNDGYWMSNVSKAQLYIYEAKENYTGQCIIICPSGGYVGLTIACEGKEWGRWFQERGITAIVLKYRMPNEISRIPFDDMQEAMRYVRSHALELNVDSDKIGVMGFSAGGHLAAYISNCYETGEINTRPDFSILFYPLITMGEKTVVGVKEVLLGDNPSQEEIDKYSIEKHVNSNTPPTLLMLSSDDPLVSPSNSIEYYNALIKNNVPVGMYIFPEGEHAWGSKSDFRYSQEMTILLEKWLKNL